ncbi:hypothetical protein LXL04_027253 [Taraxacum kok-saghyz]
MIKLSIPFGSRSGTSDREMRSVPLDATISRILTKSRYKQYNSNNKSIENDCTKLNLIEIMIRL